MKKHTIFIAEDDEGIAELYEGAFDGLYDVKIFGDGKSFFEAMQAEKPSLVILDIMLPDQDGFSILQKIREKDDKLPVVIVSAKDDEASFVKGLNKGADDYMSKPFSVLELLARVKTKLRRESGSKTVCGDFTADEAEYRAFYCGKDLLLTLKEYKLLKILMRDEGVTLMRERIFNEVWGEDYMGETRTLDMHIASLREKIKAAGGGDCITTVRGVGYRFHS